MNLIFCSVMRIQANIQDSDTDVVTSDLWGDREKGIRSPAYTVVVTVCNLQMNQPNPLSLFLICTSANASTTLPKLSDSLMKRDEVRPFTPKRHKHTDDDLM